MILYNLFQSIDTLGFATETFVDNCISGITANEKRCRDLVENSVGIVTTLAPVIGYQRAADLAKNAAAEGTKIFICAAGMAAHLAGVIAAHTTLPVIGIPMASAPFNGLDSLLAMVQMPPGIPVATVTAGSAGGKNAALLAIEMLALSDEGLAAKLKDFRKAQADKVLKDDAALQETMRS